MAQAKSPAIEVEVGDRTVRLSNPGRVYFPERRDQAGPGELLPVASATASSALRERPCMLHRFPDGVDGEKVHQKRLPHGAPPWVETVRHFPRYGRTADELCVTELGSVIWAVQMSTVEFHPWNSRRADTEKPDEWRIDLDPMPDCGFSRAQGSPRVARNARRDRRRRLAEDPAATACTCTCASNPSSRSRMCDGRPGVRPRGGAADARRGHHDLVAQGSGSADRCSSTTTRTPATTRSRPPTACAATGPARCRPRSAGTRSTTSCRTNSRSARCRPGSPNSATSTRGSTRPCSPRALARVGGAG